MSESDFKIWTPPVGIPNSSITCLACSFEPSSSAPSECGPKLGIPLSLKESESPETKGASGPTTTRSTDNLVASLTIASTSVAETL